MWSAWSSGRRSGGCTSWRGCRSGRSAGGRGCIARRSGGRCASMTPPTVCAAGGGVEARSVQGGDPSAAARTTRAIPASGSASCSPSWAMRAARRSSTTTCARCARCLLAPADLPAHDLPAREIWQFDLWEPKREIPVGHGQTRRGYVVIACAGLLARRRGRADLLQGGAGRAVGDVALRLWRIGGAAAEAGLGSRGRPARRRRAPDGGVRRLLRAASGRLVILERRRLAGQGRASSACRASCETSFEPGRLVRERARLPGPARRLVRRARERPRCIARCASARSTGSEERERCGRCPRRRRTLDRRIVVRVPPQPYVRVDRNDYSLDPRAGRPARRGARLPARGPRGRARHRRARAAGTGACSPATAAHRSGAPGGARAPAARATRQPPATRSSRRRSGRL